MKLKSIAFPYVSTGIYGYLLSEAKSIANQALNDFLDDFSNSTLIDIYLVDYDGS